MWHAVRLHDIQISGVKNMLENFVTQTAQVLLDAEVRVAVK